MESTQMVNILEPKYAIPVLATVIILGLLVAGFFVHPITALLSGVLLVSGMAFYFLNAFKNNKWNPFKWDKIYG